MTISGEVPLAAHPAVFSVERKGLGHDLVKEEVEAILLMHLAMDMRQEAVDITEVIMVAAVEVDMEMIEDIPLEGSTMALLAVDEEEEEVDTTLGVNILESCVNFYFLRTRNYWWFKIRSWMIIQKEILFHGVEFIFSGK